MCSLRKRWMRSSETLASRVPLRTQGKLLRGRMSIPTRARVVNTCRRQIQIHHVCRSMYK